MSNKKKVKTKPSQEKRCFVILRDMDDDSIQGVFRTLTPVTALEANKIVMEATRSARKENPEGWDYNSVADILKYKGWDYCPSHEAFS